LGATVQGNHDARGPRFITRRATPRLESGIAIEVDQAVGDVHPGSIAEIEAAR
jgi:hypothetical protein